MLRTRSLHAFLMCLAMLACAFDAPRAVAPSIVVVELFTSEGCSSGPPADTLLQRLADASPVEGVQIVALGEHVDYWDQQGWKDRFSSVALTNRQRVYAQALNTESIYTPQMIVDGRAEFVGSDADGDAAGQPVRTEIAIDHAWRRDNINVIAFVQEARSRHIVAAAVVPRQSARR